MVTLTIVITDNSADFEGCFGSSYGNSSIILSLSARMDYSPFSLVNSILDGFGHFFQTLFGSMKYFIYH